MVLVRAFSNLGASKRLSQITNIFNTPQSLDRLCQISGGYVRNLLRLLNNWIQGQRTLPLQRETLEALIRSAKVVTEAQALSQE